MEARRQSGNGQTQYLVENRQSPRFRLEAEIRVYQRNCPVVRGHTLDISESGIAAMLLDEVRLGEVVRLEFTLPLGEIETHALVRNRNAFRYGFQFVEAASTRDLIGRTCSLFSVDQLVQDKRRS